MRDMTRNCKKDPEILRKGCDGVVLTMYDGGDMDWVFVVEDHGCGINTFFGCFIEALVENVGVDTLHRERYVFFLVKGYEDWKFINQVVYLPRILVCSFFFFM